MVNARNLLHPCNMSPRKEVLVMYNNTIRSLEGNTGGFIDRFDVRGFNEFMTSRALEGPQVTEGILWNEVACSWDVRRALSAYKEDYDDSGGSGG
jgi:hypothetical protein